MLVALRWTDHRVGTWIRGVLYCRTDSGLVGWVLLYYTQAVTDFRTRYAVHSNNNSNNCTISYQIAIIARYIILILRESTSSGTIVCRVDDLSGSNLNPLHAAVDPL